MLIFTVSDRVAMWSVEWIGFSIATSERSTKSGYLGGFKSSPLANCCWRQVCVWCCHLSAIECGVPLFMEREAVTREPVSCSLPELPTTWQRTRDVNPESEVRTIIGGGPYQQLSPDQYPALVPLVISNPTTSNQANFNLTYWWWGVWSYASYWPSMDLSVAK